VHEDNELRVGNDRCPHVFDTLAIDSSSRVEVLNVVIGATYSKESERKLKAHVARLELLRAHCNELVVVHVSDYEAERGARCIVIVHVVRLLQLRVD